jgi:hypothetical protein
MASPRHRSIVHEQLAWLCWHDDERESSLLALASDDALIGPEDTHQRFATLREQSSRLVALFGKLVQGQSLDASDRAELDLLRAQVSTPRHPQ